MTAALVWAIVLGAIVTIGLFALLPLWIAVRFPDRSTSGTRPAYMREADAAVLPMKRTGRDYGKASERTAA